MILIISKNDHASRYFAESVLRGSQLFFFSKLNSQKFHAEVEIETLFKHIPNTYHWRSRPRKLEVSLLRRDVTVLNGRGMRNKNVVERINHAEDCKL